MVSLNQWEAQWAPYDEAAYQDALDYVRADDIVLDIGAGDLRLARRVAQIARQVYAIEKQPALLHRQLDLPKNLTVICADARYLSWPQTVTLGLLLMRHCTHVGLYAQRLRASGCRRLLTNARWGLDVEMMNLGPRTAWRDVKAGWYACLCGHTGFVACSPEQLTEARMEQISEVEECPDCQEK